MGTSKRNDKGCQKGNEAQSSSATDMGKYPEDAATKPCVGCGFCCRQAPCALSVRIYGGGPKCPALVWDGKRYWCKIISHPIVGPKHREELAIGAGCCSPMFNQDRINIPSPKEEDKIYTLSHEAQVIISAFAKEWISSDVLSLAMMSAAETLKDPRFYDAAMILIKEQRSSFMEGFMG
jgi:hypothetical protein